MGRVDSLTPPLVGARVFRTSPRKDSPMANYGLISCDDHLDMNQLPADLWTSRMPPEFKDRAPHVEETDGRAVWVCDGQNWGFWSGKASGFKGPKPIFTAFDRGGIIDQTERRPAVAELRLADMD